MKSINIFLKDGVYRISPSDKTSKGMFMASYHVIFLDPSISLQELGQEVLKNLNEPPNVIPHPRSKEDMIEFRKQWHRAMQIKSWRSFVKGAKDILIMKQEDKIKIVPTRNDESEGSFYHLNNKARFCSADDPEALGQAIIDAFADCE